MHGHGLPNVVKEAALGTILEELMFEKKLLEQY
jgi:hypothetical protein